MATVQMVKIDSKKLRKELDKRNLTAREASRAIYFTDTYLNTCMRNGTLSVRAVKALQREYSLDPERYVVKDEPQEEPQEAPQEAVQVFSLDNIVEELKAVNGGGVVTREVLDDILGTLLDISTELTTIRKALTDEEKEV